MRSAPGDLENPGPGSAYPLPARNRLLEEVLHEHVDAGIAFRRVDLRLTDQVRRKMKGKVSCV